MHGNQHRVGTDQRIQGQQVESRRTIDDDEVESVPDGSERISKAEFPVFGVYQLEIDSDQILVRRKQPQVLKLGRLQRAQCLALADEHFVGTVSIGILRQAQTASRIRLRVTVHQQRVQFGGSQRCR